MKTGTFIFHPNFVFEDGEVGNKIIVLLNDGSDGVYIIAKMTSKNTRFGISHGCQVLDRFPNYYLVKGSCCLRECTWIQLHVFYELSLAELEEKIVKNTIHRVGELTPDELKKLLSCCTNSEDINGYHLDIVQKSYKQIADGNI